MESTGLRIKVLRQSLVPQVGNDFAWSGSSNAQWVESKHKLDEIATTGSGPLASRLNRVVFRFALASAKASPDFEGFAVDNVRIGERTRTILLESFANTPPTRYSQAHRL
ncbi:MAG: hypothetical protein WDN75_10645 [Bacteroidota bacterium]